MRHALGSLAAAALAAGVLAWLASPLHANGPVQTNSQFVNDPNVRVFTPTPRSRDTEEPEATAPPPVVVNVIVDPRGHGQAYYAGLALDTIEDPKFKHPKFKHSKFKHPRFKDRKKTRSFRSRHGFRSDWSFGLSRKFSSGRSFGTNQKFASGKSFGTSRKFASGKSFRSARGFSRGKSFRGGRSFSAGRSFTGRGGSGRGHGRH